jgi:hypothetical protein
MAAAKRARTSTLNEYTITFRLEELPLEPLLIITRKSPLQARGRLGRCSKYLSAVVRTPSIWRRITFSEETGRLLNDKSLARLLKTVDAVKHTQLISLSKTMLDGSGLHPLATSKTLTHLDLRSSFLDLDASFPGDELSLGEFVDSLRGQLKSLTTFGVKGDADDASWRLFQRRILRRLSLDRQADPQGAAPVCARCASADAPQGGLYLPNCFYCGRPACSGGGGGGGDSSNNQGSCRKPRVHCSTCSLVVCRRKACVKKAQFSKRCGLCVGRVCGVCRSQNHVSGGFRRMFGRCTDCRLCVCAQCFDRNEAADPYFEDYDSDYDGPEEIILCRSCTGSTARSDSASSFDDDFGDSDDDEDE